MNRALNIFFLVLLVGHLSRHRNKGIFDLKPMSSQIGEAENTLSVFPVEGNIPSKESECAWEDTLYNVMSLQFRRSEVCKVLLYCCYLYVHFEQGW